MRDLGVGIDAFLGALGGSGTDRGVAALYLGLSARACRAAAPEHRHRSLSSMRTAIWALRPDFVRSTIALQGWRGVDARPLIGNGFGPRPRFGAHPA